jgi:hypothetical protein
VGLCSLGGRRIERRGSRTSRGRRNDPCAVRRADQRNNGYRCDVGDRVNSVCSEIAAGGGGNAAAEAHSPSGALEDHDADAPLMAFANDCDGWVRVMQCDGALLVTGSGVFAGPRWDVLFRARQRGCAAGRRRRADVGGLGIDFCWYARENANARTIAERNAMGGYCSCRAFACPVPHHKRARRGTHAGKFCGVTFVGYFCHRCGAPLPSGVRVPELCMMGLIASLGLACSHAAACMQRHSRTRVYAQGLRWLCSWPASRTLSRRCRYLARQMGHARCRNTGPQVQAKLGAVLSSTSGLVAMCVSACHTRLLHGTGPV